MNIQDIIAFTATERTHDWMASKRQIAAGIGNPFGVVRSSAIPWFADVTASVLLVGPGKITEDTSGFPLAI